MLFVRLLVDLFFIDILDSIDIDHGDEIQSAALKDALLKLLTMAEPMQHFEQDVEGHLD